MRLSIWLGYLSKLVGYVGMLRVILCARAGSEKVGQHMEFTVCDGIG